MVNDKGLLFVEPRKLPGREPLIDDLTKKMTAALNKCEKGTWIPEGDPQFRAGDSWKGFHLCVCRAVSSAQDLFYRKQNIATNSLCVHYLAFHRDEIPESELDKVRALPGEYAEPTEDQLFRPKKVEFNV